MVTDSNFTAELGAMKRVIIRRNPRTTTLLDLLKAKRQNFEKIASTRLFRELSTKYNHDFSVAYPHFGFIFNQRIPLILKRFNLIEHGIDDFNKITDLNIPWHVTLSIFENLESKDLKNMNQAAKLRKEINKNNIPPRSSKDPVQVYS